MSEVNNFELASRKGLRFSTPAGSLGVEDLWNLPLTSTVKNRPNLNDIAAGLDELLNKHRVSFVTKKAEGINYDKLRFDIVVHVINVRMAENEAKVQASAKAEKKQRLLELISEKQDEDLKSKSLDDLVAMVNDLE